MNIKNLKIIGFKSFCQKTEMSFHSGINAIVGPNGCGKSNISDALRWVMGEQNIRQLRGERMEDIIFAGSRENKPMGMAEVTMVIENNGGGMPPQYGGLSEMEITRRVYRSGESEYLINKKPCLLKDIREIFMDTGLNPRAYSIIEQGSIMEIVKSSPQELRKMLEEAAGITKYRERKAATERKIKATRENLDRVNDIILEVQRQVRCAHRQANEAKRFINSKQELTGIEATLYFHQYQSLKESWQSRTLEHSKLVGENERVRGLISVAEARMEERRVNLLGVEKELSEAQESYYRANGRREVAENQIRHLADRIKDYRHTLDGAGQSLMELSTRKEHAETTLKNMRSSLEETQASLFATEPSLEEYSKRKDRHLSDIEQRKILHDKVRQDLNRTAQEKRSLLEVIASAEARLEGDAKFLSDYQAEEQRLEEALRILQKKKEKTGSELAEALSRFSLAAAKLKKADREMMDCETEARLETTAVEETIRQLAEMESRLGYLENVQKRGDNLKEGARRLYQLASREGENGHDCIGILGHLITVEKKYRTAIETALSDKLESVLVEGKDAAISLADAMKAEGVSHVTVLPNNSWPKHAGITGKTKIGLGPAWQFVSSGGNGMSGLIRLLLENVYIVADMDEALSLRETVGKSVSFCTLDGDMIHAWGGITVGGNQPSPEGILSVAEEINRLSGRLSELRKCRDSSDEKIASLKDRLEVIRDRKSVTEREYLEAQGSVNSLRVESEKLTEESVRRRQQRETIEKDIQQRTEERNKDFRNLESWKQTLKTHEARELEFEAAAEQFEAESRATDDTRNELQKKISELEVIRAAAFEKKRSQEQALGQLERELEDITKRMADLNASKEDLARKISDSEDGLHRQNELLGELDAMSGSAARDMERLQSEHGELTAGIDERNEELKKLRKDWEMLSGKVSSVSVEIAELKTRMEETALRSESETGHAFTTESLAGLRAYLEKPSDELRERAQRLKARMARIGPVNLAAVEEVEQLDERLNFLTSQKEDLNEAVESLTTAIRKINRTSREKFAGTFKLVNEKFSEMFRTLFNGGKALLAIEEDVDLLEAGIHIYAQPPGKKMSKLNLLSGGEKAMAAIALLFALFAVRPAPFCLMDEVDAPLDDANVERFLKLIDTTINGSQIVLITHNKRSMEQADNLVGVTMESPGVSKLVSVVLNSSN